MTKLKEKVMDFLLYATLPDIYINAHYGEALREAHIRQIARDLYDIQKEISKLKKANK